MTDRTRRLIKIKLAWGVIMLSAIWGVAWAQHSYNLGIMLTLIVIVERAATVYSLIARGRRVNPRRT